MTARQPKQERFVRYVSPFGSPAWVSRARAEELLAEDDARYVEWSQLGILIAHQRQVGSPRIEEGPR